jgi:hypothetical protein
VLVLAGCVAQVPSRPPQVAATGAEAAATAPGRYGQGRLEGPQDARNHYAPIVAMLTPGYTVRLAPAGDEEAEHGFVWSVPVWFREPDWRHGAALSWAQFPTTGRRSGRLAYRLRLWSAPGEQPLVHLLAGAGGFWDLDEGVGPRAELGWLLGRYGRGGALLSLGWEYAASTRLHAGDLSLTFYVPYVVR